MSRIHSVWALTPLSASESIKLAYDRLGSELDTSVRDYATELSWYVEGSRPRDDDWVESSSTERLRSSIFVLDAALVGRNTQFGQDSIIGFVSPRPSLTHSMLDEMQVAFEELNGVLSVFSNRLDRSTLMDLPNLRTLRHSTPGAERLTRYTDSDLAKARVATNSLEYDEVTAVTSEIEGVTVNVFGDGQIYLHNVEPNFVPTVIVSLGRVLWASPPENFGDPVPEPVPVT